MLTAVRALENESVEVMRRGGGGGEDRGGGSFYDVGVVGSSRGSLEDVAECQVWLMA